MSDAKVKACPFCGSRARVRRSALIIGAFQVKCDEGHIDGFIHETKADAIAAWNNRAALTHGEPT